MRPLLAALLLLLLAGCTTPAADVAPASAPAAAGEVALPSASGELLVATNAPLPDAPCPGVGAAFTPAPSHGAWVDWTLPAGARFVRGALESDMPATLEIGWRVCVLQEGALVGEGSGTAPVSFEAALASDAPLRVLVAPEGGPNVLLNAGARASWALEGAALVSAPEGAA